LVFTIIIIVVIEFPLYRGPNPMMIGSKLYQEDRTGITYNSTNMIFNTEPCDTACKETNEKMGRICEKQKDGNYLCKSESRFTTIVAIPWGATNSSLKNNFITSNTKVSLEINNTVEWTNADDFSHSIESNDGTFSSPTIPPNGTWTFVFNKPGTYKYHGDYPWMQGVITVVDFDPNYHGTTPLFKGTNSPEVFFYLFKETDSFWYIQSLKVLDNNTISIIMSDYQNNIWIGNPITKTVKIGDSFIGNCGNYIPTNSQVEFLTLKRIVSKPTPFAEFEDKTGLISVTKCIFDKLEK